MNMIRIVICDDEELFTNRIEKYTRDFFDRHNIKVAIKCFNDSTSLISDIQNQTNLFLLDVMMPGNSGLELASVIRDVQPDAYIIFISNMEDAVFTSFKYAPLRFIRKEFIDEELSEALNAFSSEFHSSTYRCRNCDLLIIYSYSLTQDEAYPSQTLLKLHQNNNLFLLNDVTKLSY